MASTKFTKNISASSGHLGRHSDTYRVRQKEGLRECGGSGDDMGVVMYSFRLNISPEMSQGVLGCDSILLQNHMRVIL